MTKPVAIRKEPQIRSKSPASTFNDGKVANNMTNSQNNCGTLNLNTTGPFESPSINKIKKRLPGDGGDKSDNKGNAHHGNDDSVNVSDINNTDRTHSHEDSMANSSLLAEILKDDPNVINSNSNVSKF